MTTYTEERAICDVLNANNIIALYSPTLKDYIARFFPTVVCLNLIRVAIDLRTECDEGSYGYDLADGLKSIKTNHWYMPLQDYEGYETPDGFDLVSMARDIVVDASALDSCITVAKEHERLLD